MAQEKAQAFNGKKVNGQLQFDRDKTVYVNHYYFYIDDEEFGPLFLKICSYAPWAIKGRRKNSFTDLVESCSSIAELLCRG